MKNVRVARRYATALMTAANEQKSIDATAADLGLVGDLLRGSRELRLLISSPVVSPAKKKAVFKEVLQKRIAAETLRFIHLLIAKGRESILPDVIEQFENLRDAKYGIVNVDVRSAVEFTAPQEKGLQAQLEKYTRRKVRVRFALDTSIRGGLVVKIGDTVLDASVRHQLELLRERFVSGGPLSN
jgi:F-type H+-transporting ATPase subunit delta